MKKKHIHKIVINAKKKYQYQYSYDFGSTKGVQIELSKSSICITAELTKMYDKNEMLSQGCYLFPDAIKKALTLHLILFSENIEIKTMTVHIDDDSDVVINTEMGHIPPVYSMIKKQLYHNIISKWNKDEISGFLKLTKSSNDNRLAALNAFIISKSKQFETDRFIYLWTAFNGMYNYFAKQILNDKKAGDTKKIKYIQKFYDLGNEEIKDTKENKDKTKIAENIIALICHNCNFEYKITREELKKGRYSYLNKFIQEQLFNTNTKKTYDVTAYGYLLTQFSYYFRCNILHGDEPYALFSYAEERDIKCLRFINELLDEFIEENLHKWFDKNCEEQLKEKAKTMNMVK